MVFTTSVEALSRHYGVRVTYRIDGRPVVDVSQPSVVGHAENAVERPDTSACKMMRFRGDRILFTVELDEDERLVLPTGSLTIHERSAVVIQRAYRRHVSLGDPTLPWPPVTRDTVRPLRTP